MGEIATWSAVKSKVGLGKDGNDCPTKAELLALSPTGTGGNYVGLELSNAGSYGNNECVKLEDIHKVTYKYTFTAINTSFTFPAIGGESTPARIGLTSTKQKYWDGVATGAIERWNYGYPALPAWLTLTADLGYRATENTTTSEREFTHILTQQDSGKQLTITLTQTPGVETWEYNFTAQDTAKKFSALGGFPTEGDKHVRITSTKQRYISGVASGSPVEVSYASGAFPSWLTYEHGWKASENKSLTSRSGERVLTQNESGKKVTITFTQEAGVMTYGTPTVYLGSIADIPASGGTAATPTYTYSQLWGWNGKTNDGGTISSGASVVWSENISGSNLGTTAKARTKLGSRTLTVTLNGKSGSASIDVYQAENSITSTTDGTPVISLSANSYSISNSGGSSNIYASVSIPITNHWSSGSISAGSSKSATPTVSASGTGFSLNSAKTVLTVTENTGTSTRSCTVTASYSGATTKTIKVTQSAASVSYKYYLAFTSPTGSRTTSRTGLSALGGNNFTVDVAYSFKTKVINGSEISTRYPLALTVTSKPSWVTNVATTTLSSDNGNYGLTLTLTENTVESTRSGTIKLRQAENDDNGWELTVNITQKAVTITYDYVFKIAPV